MSRTILLADDSITIQKIVNLTFSGEGIDVVTVGNGDAALRKIHELHPSLILADIFMPGKNGYEVCEAVKNDPELELTPVILLVGAFEPFDDHEAARVKADSHLTKPFEIKTLISQVRTLIEAAEEQAMAKSEASAQAAEAPVVAEEAGGAETAFVPGEGAADETIQMTSPEFSSSESEAHHEGPTIPIMSSEAAPVEVEATALPSDGFVDSSIPMPALSESPYSASAWETPQSAINEALLPSIEETDPLGLEGVGEAQDLTSLITGSASDSKSLVVDIWESAETPSMIGQSSPSVEIPPVAAVPFLEAKSRPEGVSDVETELHSEAVHLPMQEETLTLSETETEPSLVSNEASLAPPVSAIESSSKASLGDAEITELIEMIANRVVEKLSRDVIERIAWEVVPDMAELMIRERVESQFKAEHRQ